jgi:hypothetical protein
MLGRGIKARGLHQLNKLLRKISFGRVVGLELDERVIKFNLILSYNTI